MTDPERLLDNLPGDLGRTLIEAGVDEQPSDAARRRALVALGIGVPVFGIAGVALGASAAQGAAAGSASALASSSMVTGIVIAKWLGAGVVAGALATATAHYAQQPAVSERAVPVATVAVVAPPAEPVAPPVPAVVQAPAVEEPEEPEPARAVAPEEVSVPEDATPLAREVAFVDRARALLEGGSARAAADALSTYEREFEQPKLLPEVWFLRMRAAESAGDTAGARILATRLVDVFPRSPHTARARELLAKVTKEESVP
jgi:hypothetical protein